MRRALLATRVTLLLALLEGCVGQGGPSSSAPAPPATAGPLGIAISAVARLRANPADASAAAVAINDFGLALLLRGTKPEESAVISPASIALALGMARPGARGETAAEMDAALRDVASDEHAAWLNALDAALTSRTGTFKDRFDKDADVLLRIANTTFAQQGFEWNPAYLDALAFRFGSGVHLADYITAPEPARMAINAWVDERTEGRIPELLPQGTIDDLTRIVLVNAIYLKAAWLQPFEKKATSDAPFTTLDGRAVELATMHHTASYPYAAGDGWRAVELPYVGRQLAMLVIVPDDLLGFEDSLDGRAFGAIVSSLEDQRVALSLPKFGLESQLSLRDALEQLGMRRAFDPDRADFSGMTQAAKLYVSAVIHQANLDLDEEGTEAAAATGVVMGVTSMPPEPIVLKVDRPFLFALRDRETGAIVFLGRVVEPEITG